MAIERRTKLPAFGNSNHSPKAEAQGEQDNPVHHRRIGARKVLCETATQPVFLALTSVTLTFAIHSLPSSYRPKYAFIARQ